MLEGRRLQVEVFQWKGTWWVSAVLIHPAPDRKFAQRDYMGHVALAEESEITLKHAVCLAGQYCLDVSDRLQHPPSAQPARRPLGGHGGNPQP